MAEQQQQDRTEEATPYRLEQAREKGSVARSAEVNSLFAVAAFLGFLGMWGHASVRHLLASFTQILNQGHTLSFADASALSWLLTALTDVLVAVAPLMGMVMLAAVVGSILQFGVVFSAHPIKPDWTRINPLDGLKRLFTRRTLFETIKNISKLALFGAVLALTVTHLMPAMLGLLHTDVRTFGGFLVDKSAGVVAWLALAMLLVAIVDAVFAKREYARKLMMSRRDLKDEYKHREGDPKIKQRIRELRNEMRKRSRSLQNTAGADVLITNPTHLAVALSYRHGEMPAPQIVAKGAGEMVEAMKALARRHGVVIVENRPLARALYTLNLDTHIPEEHFAQVARILLWIQETRRLRSARSPSP